MARSSTTRKPGDPALPGAGRKPVKPEWIKALADMQPQALENLRAMLVSEDKQERMFATKEVNERNLGKAVQAVELGDPEGKPLGIEVRLVKAGSK